MTAHKNPSGVVRTVSGSILYTSRAPERLGAERGRETFRMDIHADGCRVLAAHSEIDDPPPVVRDVNLRLAADGRPADCFVRIAVGGAFRGSAWFRFDGAVAECEADTLLEGRVSQALRAKQAIPGFGNHAVVNDAYLLSLYDLSRGQETQMVEGLMLSSPDHRGATGPMLFTVDLAIQYHGIESIDVQAGRFDAHHFAMVDVPGMPQEHPPYHLWCTNDGDYILLKAHVEGYMQTAYELVQLTRTGSDPG